MFLSIKPGFTNGSFSYESYCSPVEYFIFQTVDSYSYKPRIVSNFDVTPASPSLQDRPGELSNYFMKYDAQRESAIE